MWEIRFVNRGCGYLWPCLCAGRSVGEGKWNWVRNQVTGYPVTYSYSGSSWLMERPGNESGSTVGRCKWSQLLVGWRSCWELESCGDGTSAEPGQIMQGQVSVRSCGDDQRLQVQVQPWMQDGCCRRFQVSPVGEQRGYVESSNSLSAQQARPLSCY